MTHAKAAGFFESLFGGLFAPQRPAAYPSTDLGSDVSGQAEEPADTAFCVRLCDGRYYPIVSDDSNSTPVRMCSAMCPAATTRVFHGSEITSASDFERQSLCQAWPSICVSEIHIARLHLQRSETVRSRGHRHLEGSNLAGRRHRRHREWPQDLPRREGRNPPDRRIFTATPASKLPGICGGTGRRTSPRNPPGPGAGRSAGIDHVVIDNASGVGDGDGWRSASRGRAGRSVIAARESASKQNGRSRFSTGLRPPFDLYAVRLAADRCYQIPRFQKS